jgi:hypothetical protein
MSEITFAEAIRMVHPDSNPNINDAGVKVRTIMMYKKDPKKMFDCLFQWGLVKSNTAKSTTKRSKIKIKGIDSFLKNYIYNGSVVIKHKRIHGFFEVQRTTNKRVYFTPNTINIHGLKYCHINSVIKAFKKV